jgi:hypothetical protein
MDGVLGDRALLIQSIRLHSSSQRDKLRVSTIRHGDKPAARHLLKMAGGAGDPASTGRP